MGFEAARHVIRDLDAAGRALLMARAEEDLTRQMRAVEPVIEAVRTEGDAALVRYAKEFDNADIGDIGVLVTEGEFDAAHEAIDAQLHETLKLAAGNIREFHAHQMPKRMSWQMEIKPGVFVGERTTPIAKAACYCPMGKGSFPSVALMTTIPASVAGVPDITLLTPPAPNGQVDAAVLVAARLAGVSRVVRAGGAVAAAAAAFGTQSVPSCDRFEGPGSPWLSAAKRVLAGKLVSRLPAGPSESVIFADPSADPRLCALDMLIESEHGPDSSAFLVTWSESVENAVGAALSELLDRMGQPRRGYCETVLSGDSGGIVLAQNESEAYAFVNEYAPEHLQIMSREPDRHLEHIVNASEVLLGEITPGSIANYMMGPNCVLPTNGAAVAHSPLSVRDFLKVSSIGRLDERGYALLAPHTEAFARYEGFEGHAYAVSKDRMSSD